MKLIADSGSTKTDWRVLTQDKALKSVITKGINPYYQTKDEIEREIVSELLPALGTNEFENVYFYGAGCTAEKKAAVENALSDCLNASVIEVNSDMLATARGLCGHENGIACILGTGSNSCFYDGEKITHNVSPLGFILGDEGSGAVLGRLFIGDLLKNQLSAELKNTFLQQYSLSVPDIIDKVYRQPFPNRFLAALTPFILENIHEESLYNLVFGSFSSFLKRNVMQYPRYDQFPIHFTGSIAYHFSGILKEAVQSMNLKQGKILQSPMEGLIEYHRNR